MEGEEGDRMSLFVYYEDMICGNFGNLILTIDCMIIFDTQV